MTDKETRDREGPVIDMDGPRGGENPIGITFQIVFTALAAFALVVALVWLGTGFYQVKPGESAAIQTFGAARLEPEAAEGLHWHWPSPIGRTTVLQTQKSRTAEVGYNTLPDGVLNAVTGENWQRDLRAGTMIAGDLSLLEIQLVAQYYIGDLNAYLFEADDPGVTFAYSEGNNARDHRSHPQGRPDGQSIKDALEVAIRRSVGQRTIDQVLVTERESIEFETMTEAQQILDAYRTGLTITSVQLQEVRPPDQVKSAFDDVLRAREERDTRINQALTFESQVLPTARGQAERIRRESEAYRATRIAAAEAEADRFLAILQEYRASPDIIAKRMYLETLDAVLPRVNQIIVGGAEVPALIINSTGAGGITPVPMPNSSTQGVSGQ